MSPVPGDEVPLPALVRPMLATAGTLPQPGDDSDWAHEMKWDGVRAMVYVTEDRVRVLTRNDRDVAVTYPELTDIRGALKGRPALLDGEIVAFGPTGRPDFGELQQRMHVSAPDKVRALQRATPVTLLIFDLVHLDGRSLLKAAYEERRELLESLHLAGNSWSTPPAFLGNGLAAVAVSRHQGLEGVVAKRRDSYYVPGIRSREWLKIKNLRTQEVVVGGWRPGAGHRSGGIGSLLVGIPGPTRLTYVGHVGSGFTQRELTHLLAELTPTDTCPFGSRMEPADVHDAVWVRPDHVGEVTFTEWTKDGRLRHPVWRGLRPDKLPGEVQHDE